MADDRGMSMFKTPFGRDIDSKTFEEVDEAMVNMAKEGKLETGDVVYLGKHADGDFAQGGFLYVTSGFMQALKQEEQE